MTKNSMELVDFVRELTEAHTHREHYTRKIGHTWYGQDHITTAPALLDQLTHTAPGSGYQDGPRQTPGSRPSVRVEAIDCAVWIDLEASRWVKDLGEDDPADTKACIRRLHGLLPSAHQATATAVVKDVRRWWTQARVVTGWDSPAWRPDNTCPMCAVHGSLRINLVAEAGFCVECRETWDQANIGLLAEHIRSEADAKPPRPTRIRWCGCHWPHEPTTGRWGLCSACGSAACVNAEPVADSPPGTPRALRGA